MRSIVPQGIAILTRYENLCLLKARERERAQVHDIIAETSSKNVNCTLRMLLQMDHIFATIFHIADKQLLNHRSKTHLTEDYFYFGKVTGGA